MAQRYTSAGIPAGRSRTRAEAPLDGTEGRKIVIRKGHLIDGIEQHQPPGGSTTGGEVNASLLAVGACCGCPTKGAADRRQSLPPATATGPAAPHAASAP